MREEYDFENMEGEKNPYIKKLKKSVTIRLDTSTVDYFRSLSDETTMPYQTLINLYLRDCVENNKKLEFNWV